MTKFHLPYRELPEPDPGTPDTRSAWRYLAWLAGRQRWLLVLNATFGVIWMVAQALVWFAVGVAIDQGVTHHDTARLLAWGLVVLALGATQALAGAARHQLAVTNWMHATYRTTTLLAHHVAATGAVLPEEIPQGDLVNTATWDAIRVGQAYDSFARFAGSIVSWIVVSIILLTTSVELGLVVLVGVPVLTAATTPIMRPLHRTQARQREETGRLAALGSDTVAGLRILRGVGGEAVFYENYRRQSQRVRDAGVRVAWPQAGLESGQVLLPAILTSIVTFLGARDVLDGTLQPGQLVAFFGYSTFLTTPLRTAIEYVVASTRSYVSASRVLRVLSVHRSIVDGAETRTWPEEVRSLVDVTSGLELSGGRFVAVVTEPPDDATRLIDRLGRFHAGGGRVELNGVDLAEFSLDDVRAHVLVSEIDPRLFSGELRRELSPHRVPDDERILHVMEQASSLDILDALDDGLSTYVEERGRAFSGGQRQRLALVRALLADTDVLLLVEPTSAVDSHTERRIAHGLRFLRAGRTTLVATSSPLLLEVTDEVVVVVNDEVVDRGRHDELVARSADYRRIVLREEGE